MDPLAIVSELFLTSPILISILGLIYHSTFWIFQYPGWEIPAVGWLYLIGLPFGCVDLSDDFLESFANFWATHTRARI